SAFPVLQGQQAVTRLLRSFQPPPRAPGWTWSRLVLISRYARMDLTRLPVGVIREVLRVERGDHAEHWIWNCVGAAVATGPAITAVDRDLFGSGNANPDPNLGHTMANTGEQ